MLLKGLLQRRSYQEVQNSNVLPTGHRRGTLLRVNLTFRNSKPIRAGEMFGQETANLGLARKETVGALEQSIVMQLDADYLQLQLHREDAQLLAMQSERHSVRQKEDQLQK